MAKKKKKKLHKRRDKNILLSIFREISLDEKVVKSKKDYDRKKEKEKIKKLLTEEI
jgi:hypothetical protein